MKKTILWFAYFLVYTTPIQLFFCFWIYSYVFSVEYSILSFSTLDFMELTFLKFVKTWMYSWFWNSYLDFIWGLPAAIMATLKLIANTWLGLWLLPKAKRMN